MSRAGAGRPTLPAGRRPRPGRSAARTGRGTAIPASIRRSYHPSQEGSPRGAVEYLAAPPAARTAADEAGAAGRAAMS